MPHELTHISDTGLSTPFEDDVVKNNQSPVGKISTSPPTNTGNRKRTRAEIDELIASRTRESAGTSIEEHATNRPGVGFGGVGVFGRGVIVTNIIKKRR